MYGSANRDERRWEGPEKFDVTRKLTGEHLAFGRGPHLCVGAHLARLEIRSIFEELVKRVERFELGDTECCLNNTLRGFDVCEVIFIDRNEGAVMKILLVAVKVMARNPHELLPTQRQPHLFTNR